jgi:hypothetical protein
MPYYYDKYPAIKVPVSPAEYFLGEWEGNDLQSSSGRESGEASLHLRGPDDGPD